MIDERHVHDSLYYREFEVDELLKTLKKECLINSIWCSIALLFFLIICTIAYFICF